jgi:RND family efflux transporter MFP subunit
VTKPRTIGLALLVLASVLVAAGIRLARHDGRSHGRRGGPSPAAVEVAAVKRGAIELTRTFSGSLEARAQFVVAADSAGRVQRVRVDIADPVEQGQVVAELEDAEETQAVAEAAAELGVARASVADAEAGLDIARRELERLDALAGHGVVSQAQIDAGRAAFAARQSRLEVARAQVERQKAVLARARIRSRYSNVIASWAGDPGPRVVAARHVDEGDRVGIGDPLITVVSLDPLVAVVYVTERDYGNLKPGQAATVTSDAYPDRRFSGTIRRIAPVFAAASRQARMEITIDNSDHILKPGMFVRAAVTLERVEHALIVPVAAVVTRGGSAGLFVVTADGTHVVWRPVELGIRAGDQIQVRGEDVAGRVVTLGQQLIDDGSAIVIPEAVEPAGSHDEAE